MAKTWLISIMILFIAAFNAAAQSEIVPVWESAIPGEIRNKEYNEKDVFKDGELQNTSKVVTPTLSVYLPEGVKANGTAVLILPGGGYGHLSMLKEGKKIAQWLNSMGITAFVLKYRLPSDVIMKNKTTGPFHDAQESMKIIRRNAVKWGIDPQKVGVIGFSAGGHLAATLSTHLKEAPQDTVSSRPDFSLLIYPVISMKSEITHKGSRLNLLGENPQRELIDKFSNELRVTPATPPTFIVHAADDLSVPAENSLNYFLALRNNHVPAELHIYEKGGHGFGLGIEGQDAYWPVACATWLKVNAYLP
jgi:acetyl esterase/lipase